MFRVSRKILLSCSFLLLFLLPGFAAQHSVAYSSPSAIKIQKTIYVGYNSDSNGAHGDPQFLVYNPSNKFVYVSNAGDYCSASEGGCDGSFQRSRIAVINSTSNQVVAKVPVGWGAADIIYNPSNKEVYVVNLLNNTVSVLKGLEVVKTISVGPESSSNGNLVYNPSNQFVYVGNDKSVTVISSSTNTVVATVALRSNVFTLHYDPSNQEVYAAQTNSISAIKGTKIVATINVANVFSFAYDPANNDMYALSSQVHVISGTNKIVATISLPPICDQMQNCISPLVIGYDPANTHIYVGSANSIDLACVFVISSATNKVIAKIDVTSVDSYYPYFSYLTYDPANKDMYFSIVDGQNGGGIGVLDSATNELVASLGGYYANQIVYDPSNTCMYAPIPVANTVRVITS